MIMFINRSKNKSFYWLQLLVAGQNIDQGLAPNQPAIWKTFLMLLAFSCVFNEEGLLYSPKLISYKQEKELLLLRLVYWMIFD